MTLLAACLIVLSAVLAYHNSFAGPFIYDDADSIAENQTIRRLWPIGPVFSPPTGGETVSGRPLLNLSLAINYAVSGLQVWSYHATNLLIHIGAALLLMGIVRRTFLAPALRDRFGRVATPLAAACALVWALHPLQTESVTYIIQRAESLAGLFYLLTLYCVIRGAGEKGDCPPKTVCDGNDIRDHWSRLYMPGPHVPWYAAAVLACLLGMACKETVVTAPLVVLLYDRTFLSASFAEALRRRWALYVGLAAAWGLQAYLVCSAGLIVRQTEFGAPDAWSYARTQPGVILHYLRLSVWPRPLCLDYAWPVANTLGEILPGAMVVGSLLAATLWGLIGRRTWGFVGACFFLALAPTSSVLPLAQLAFEHRIYLPLAAVTVLVVTAGCAFWDGLLSSPLAPRASTERAEVPSSLVPCPSSLVPLAALAVVLGALGYITATRNRDYRSAEGIWRDTIAKRPHNPVAHNHLGNALDDLGRIDEALEQYYKAVQLNPHYIGAHNNLGTDLAAVGKTDEALEHFQQALRLRPDHPETHNNLGNVLAKVGRTDEAIEHFYQALRLKPDCTEAYNNLGNALTDTGRPSEAIEQYQEALRRRPDYVDAYNNLGNALAKLGKVDEAIEQYQQSLRLKPGSAETCNSLAKALADAGRMPEAIEHWQQAVGLKPAYAEAHYNLGSALMVSGNLHEAIAHYREALRLKNDYAKARHGLAMAHYRLANALVGTGKINEAVAHYDEILQLLPDSIEALNDLAWLLATRETTAGGNPARAVQLAQRARELGGQENARCLDTLAAAYAAAGRFDDAAVAAAQAIQLAESTGQMPLAALIRARLELYRNRQAYCEPPR